MTMELQHTVMLTKNFLSCYKLPMSSVKSNPQPFLSFRPFSSVWEPSKTKKRVGSRIRLKCGLDYFNNKGNDVHYDDGVVGTHYPRPHQIPWRKELCNSVQLIGTVGMPVQIKHLSSGKALAWTRLAVKKSQTDTSWISLTFWDDLAHTAFQHVEKGHQVYVSGRLVSDTVENDEGKQQTYYKVTVQQLNFVERSSSPIALYNGESDSTTPGRKYGNYVSNTTGSIEELWQAFFANPVEWWDNRKNKKTPNYPDFKHKDTGEALWVEGRNNPSWVKSQLAILDSRMAAFQDQSDSMQMNIMAGDNFTNF